MNRVHFQKIVYNNYKKNKRKYPWRETTDPYKILVSEMMLQQTQTDRVVPKYNAFIEIFPTAKSLATASTADVVKLWQGLGYNRRALYLKKCAETITQKYNGKFPETEKELITLPGIGPYTAAAIMAFAYNKSAVVIETNIRTAYIYHFFSDKKNILDKEIISVIVETQNTKNPRKWYNALMDYGAMLKKEYGNLSRKSKTYTKQSTFKGSEREVRGKILKILTSSSENKKKLLDIDPRAEKVLEDLKREGFIIQKRNTFMLKEN